MQSNPWFWGGLNRWEFERNLQRDAVQLRDKNARVHVPKVSIEDVRKRKDALAAKGINVANTSNVIVGTNMGVLAAEPRKIK